MVYVEAREKEYFLSGGLLNSGRFVLPRDHDVDVFEALAITNSNALGPSGNSINNNFRGGPGNIIHASSLFIVRQFPNGAQTKIYVDLNEAVNDPRQRVIVQPGDLLMLHYKPAELWGNVALNFVTRSATSSRRTSERCRPESSRSVSGQSLATERVRILRF